jgi:GTP-binding nuclear protein Ran
MATFKIAILGAKGCGKSAWMRRHATGKFLKDPIPLSACELNFVTNKGIYRVILSEGKCERDASIYMMDLTKPQDELKIEKRLKKCFGPKVLCGNKCDRKVAKTPLAFVRSLKETYFDISAKSNYNFEKPFLYLLRELTGFPDLEFVVMG